MSLFKGKNISLEIYGESHSEKIGVRVQGFPHFKFDKDELKLFLERRRPSSKVYSTKRIESDVPEFSGTKGSEISGEFTAEIKNSDVRSGDYSNLYGKPRPSHADYVWHKRDGALDFSGGGRFSGRLTAPLCVAGGIAKQYLKSIGIFVEAYVASVGNISGRSYKDCRISADEIIALREGIFPSLDKKDEMLSLIKDTFMAGDSVGGKVECVVSGVRAGIGDNLFGGLESKISYLVYAIPAVKGVEFGDGFLLSESFGSAANDQLYFNDEGNVCFYSNRSGGINGGISNGDLITLAVAFRPTPSIRLKQKTVDLVNKCNTEIEIKGRHDACIVPRAVPCVESAVALALLDEVLE